MAKTARTSAALTKQAAKPRKTVSQKVEGAIEAVLDTLTDAERLHRDLEPDISPEPE